MAGVWGEKKEKLKSLTNALFCLGFHWGVRYPDQKKHEFGAHLGKKGGVLVLRKRTQQESNRFSSSSNHEVKDLIAGGCLWGKAGGGKSSFPGRKNNQRKAGLKGVGKINPAEKRKNSGPRGGGGPVLCRRGGGISQTGGNPEDPAGGRACRHVLFSQKENSK